VVDGAVGPLLDELALGRHLRLADDDRALGKPDRAEVGRRTGADLDLGALHALVTDEGDADVVAAGTDAFQGEAAVVARRGAGDEGVVGSRVQGYGGLGERRAGGVVEDEAGEEARRRRAALSLGEGGRGQQERAERNVAGHGCRGRWRGAGRRTGAVEGRSPIGRYGWRRGGLQGVGAGVLIF